MTRRHFPLIPIVATLLQIVAVVLLLIAFTSIYQGFGQIKSSWALIQPSERVSTFARFFQSIAFELIIPFIAWLFADWVKATREIEYNTRVAAGIPEPEEEEEPGVVTEQPAAPPPPETPQA